MFVTSSSYVVAKVTLFLVCTIDFCENNVDLRKNLNKVRGKGAFTVFGEDRRRFGCTAFGRNPSCAMGCFLKHLCCKINFAYKRA